MNRAKPTLQLANIVVLINTYTHTHTLIHLNKGKKVYLYQTRNKVIFFFSTHTTNATLQGFSGVLIAVGYLLESFL